MKIKWKEVTRFSQIMAIVLFVIVFFLGFGIGRRFENNFILGEPSNSAEFTCAENKTIHADFYKNFVYIQTGVWKDVYLPQTISASGARYATSDESIVFWNKGNTAFVTEGSPDNITYKDCIVSYQTN